ncbi:MAG: tRNA (adenosine(37)-N6)-threonylcarbamoyltransferase complex ATPase subunit type 1 TsaE [Proteobacteria bacterium]|nr:tRNA (adenosine(37)-N6)-threonylcarbamoyltransferase complex ATPase subunit type 1 TsaE [Pseudomonadota bacterium]
MKIEFVAHGADEMRAFGARLARALLATPAADPLLVTLSGELGAGKTTLVGGFLAELGHVGPVRSPTYTLLEPYRLQGRDITHCDLYRMRHPDELDDLGFRDLRGAGSVLLVEWPERAEGRLGAADLALKLDYAGPDARALAAEACSRAGQAALERL